MPKSKKPEAETTVSDLTTEDIGTACAAIVRKYTLPHINVRTMLLMPEFWTDLTKTLRGENVEGLPAVTELTSIDPATAEVGSADITLRCLGTGFTEESVIVFNDGDEPTTFVSANEVTTGLQPSTASGPWTVTVSVRTGQVYTNPLHFAFTEPPEIVTLEDEDFDGEEVKTKKGKKGKG